MMDNYDKGDISSKVYLLFNRRMLFCFCFCWKHYCKNLIFFLVLLVPFGCNVFWSKNVKKSTFPWDIILCDVITQIKLFDRVWNIVDFEKVQWRILTSGISNGYISTNCAFSVKIKKKQSAKSPTKPLITYVCRLLECQYRAQNLKVTGLWRLKKTGQVLQFEGALSIIRYLSADRRLSQHGGNENK